MKKGTGFVDIANIYVKAGDGGDGCQSFYRDRYTRYPKPDGGHGGDGGNAIIKSTKDLVTLLDFKYKRHFKAEDGRNGSGKNKRGVSGRNCVIYVPVGCLIRDSKTNLLIRDITKTDEEVLIARGGRGGRGNSVTKIAERGNTGEEREILLELKLLADIGIIGYPNVGKSSLINCISNAKSKVASYPFTTKSPALGVVRFYDEGEFTHSPESHACKGVDEWYLAQGFAFRNPVKKEATAVPRSARDGERSRTIKPWSFTVADIPGLIENSHSGKGLGHEFLRHIERTSLLVHMIDMSIFSGRDPVSDFYSLNKELALYDKSLIEKPQILVANKMDLNGSEENLKRFKKKVKKNIFPISCETKEGLNNLLKAIFVNLERKKYD
ncbi:MAG: GTP-binding protein [Candidatus Omnitrophica bacterium]|nr:GTP-binding protein [Candidatus Omnitrophota bacterium]